MVGDILQPTHLIFVLVVALLVLGPKRLPEVARSLGNGLRDFKSAISGEDRDDEPAPHELPGEHSASVDHEDPVAAPAQPTGQPAPAPPAAPPEAAAGHAPAPPAEPAALRPPIPPADPAEPPAATPPPAPAHPEPADRPA